MATDKVVGEHRMADGRIVRSGLFVNKDYEPKAMSDELRVQRDQTRQGEIHEIVKRAQDSGFLPAPHGVLQYGDFSEVVDLQEARNQVLAADAAFMDLPAEVREAAANDPAVFLEMVEDPDQVGELVEAGLQLELPEELMPRPVDQGEQPVDPPASADPPQDPPSGDPAPA